MAVIRVFSRLKYESTQCLNWGQTGFRGIINESVVPSCSKFKPSRAVSKYLLDKLWFTDPVPFMQTIQQNLYGDWHIPYEVKEELSTKSPVDNYHKHWLCLTNRAVQPMEKLRENEYQTNYTHQKKRVWEKKPTRKEKSRMEFKKLF